MKQKQQTYEYKKYMRDGSVRVITAVVRDKKPKKSGDKNNV